MGRSVDGIVGLDPQGRVQLWNHGATRLFGFSDEEARGSKLDDLIGVGAGTEARYLAAELEREDVVCAYDDRLCTYSDTTRFFSHRRAGPCGRMASLIWME